MTMSDVGQKTIEALAQFDRDLEAGDLSGYRITKRMPCPACGGGSHPIIGCVICDGRGLLTIVVQKGNQ